PPTCRGPAADSGCFAGEWPAPPIEPAEVPPLLRVHPEAGIAKGGAERVAVGAGEAVVGQRRVRGGPRAERVERRGESDQLARGVGEAQVDRDAALVQTAPCGVRHRAPAWMRRPECCLGRGRPCAVPCDEAESLARESARGEREPPDD